MKIFVTGGAGYIGSHAVKSLGEKGHELLVYDNLSTGHADAVLYGKLVREDIADVGILESVLRDFRPDAIMHFAAFIQVGESVSEPMKYYLNNGVHTIHLLDIMSRLGIERFIYSSTAAVYGMPETIPITENAEMKPINPYGISKMTVEHVLRDTAKVGKLRYVSLRYFNAAGSEPGGKIGERHNPETHLIPLVLKAAKRLRDKALIFGTDYQTKDGTCIRDYIHVDDLIGAHILALDHLMEAGESRVYNCGYGHGYSVREIIDTAKKVTGIDFPVEETGRREGDPPVLIANSSQLKKEFGWEPGHDDIEYIIRTAWNWEKKL